MILRTGWLPPLARPADFLLPRCLWHRRANFRDQERGNIARVGIGQLEIRHVVVTAWRTDSLARRKSTRAWSWSAMCESEGGSSVGFTLLAV